MGSTTPFLLILSLNTFYTFTVLLWINFKWWQCGQKLSIVSNELTELCENIIVVISMHSPHSWMFFLKVRTWSLWRIFYGCSKTLGQIHSEMENSFLWPQCYKMFWLVFGRFELAIETKCSWQCRAHFTRQE